MVSLSEAIKKELEKSVFERLNLKKNPFLPYVPENITEMFVYRDEAEELILYISSLIKGQIPTIVIIGTKGSGKTHLLRYVFEQLKKIERDIGYVILLIDENNFTDFYKNIVMQPGEPCIVLIDNPEKILDRHREEIISLHIQPPDRIKLIAAWNQVAWNGVKSSNFSTHMKTARVFLRELPPEKLEEILKKRVKKVSIGESPFKEEAVKMLVDISKGIPFTLIFFAEKILNFTIRKNKDVIDKETTEEFIVDQGILKSDIGQLTRGQRRITKELWLLSTSEKRGVAADEISERLSISRPAVVQHLMRLAKENIVIKSVSGKKALYHINPNLLGTLESYFREWEIT